MDEEERKRIIEECRRKCACCNPSCPRRRMQEEEVDECENQRTFITFICETISVIAFIIFGSVVFWLAVGGILFDFIKRLYYSDRYVKVFLGILFIVLLLSMSFNVIPLAGSCRTHKLYSKQKQQLKIMPAAADQSKTCTKCTANAPCVKKDAEKVTQVTATAPAGSPPSAGSPLPAGSPPSAPCKSSQASCKSASPSAAASSESASPPPPPPPPPPPDYMKISLKEKHLENLNGDTPVNNIIKKTFTLTIIDEKKKEVFKTTKTVFIPELTLQKDRPALIVMLKEILLEDY